MSEILAHGTGLRPRSADLLSGPVPFMALMAVVTIAGLTLRAVG